MVRGRLAVDLILLVPVEEEGQLAPAILDGGDRCQLAGEREQPRDPGRLQVGPRAELAERPLERGLDLTEIRRVDLGREGVGLEEDQVVFVEPDRRLSVRRATEL